MALATIVVAAVAVVAVVGLAGGGRNEPASMGEYQATVVKARNRVDYSLERITKSPSVDELFERMDEAVAVLDGSAEELERARVAEGFDDENARLVRTLRAFASEVAGTVETMRDPDFVQALSMINSLSFPQWDAVNRTLSALKRQGINVEPLARH